MILYLEGVEGEKMFRKMVKKGGEWTVMELSPKEVKEATEKVRDFNREAWKASIEDAKKLLGANSSYEQQVELAKILFGRLSMTSFSVLNNHAHTIMG